MRVQRSSEEPAHRARTLSLSTMPGEPLPSKRYRVKLGHSEVSVECGSKEEAIRLARTKLSSDLPRHYDVIHGAEDEQFEVIEVDRDSSR